MNDEKIIARIPRNATQELVVRTGNYWNIDILDIRWYENGKVSRKGMRVNMKEAKKLLRAVQKAVDNYEDEDDEASLKMKIYTGDLENDSEQEED